MVSPSQAEAAGTRPRGPAPAVPIAATVRCAAGGPAGTEVTVPGWSGGSSGEQGPTQGTRTGTSAGVCGTSWFGWPWRRAGCHQQPPVTLTAFALTTEPSAQQ